MPSVGLHGVLLCASLVPQLVVGASVRARSSCPLANCHNANNVDSGAASLLEVSSESRGCGQTFMPAHFTCSHCDVQACKGCNNVICDVSKCIGKFYTQECWCTKPLNPAVDKFFCDDDCSGGLCNTNGLTCLPREKACKPWWWCKLPPPKEPDSFLQKGSSRACSKKESGRRLNERLKQTKAHLVAKEASLVAKRQIDDFSFQPGEWVCDSALLPKPDENPLTLAQTAAGFIVMDGNSCSGGFFKSKCYCYDKFKYFRGQDAMVTELDCDESCGSGPCGGKSCGKEPPPPLPPPKPAPPMDPLLQELANQGMLRNYGTQMSPVT